MIVVGERRGGMSTFLNWLTRSSRRGGKKKAGRSTAEWEFCETGKQVDAALEQQRESGAQVRLVLDRTRPEWAREGDQILRRLAAAVESDRWRETGCAVVVATHEVGALRSDTLCSAIFTRGKAFRLPHFDPSELERWVELLLTKKKAARSLAANRAKIGALARRVKALVGGQPLLTHMVFRAVDDTLPSVRTFDALEASFTAAGRSLEQNPPHIVERWKPELLKLLVTPACRRLLEVYVGGDAKSVDETTQLPDDDALLFMAGWVGLTEPGRWGIRSQCHRAWARTILRERSA
ncbi:MAG: hypothetical protein M9894_05380 [Planctomycetes bacterium]|nr:hypothetical protein [Planctomycetota bacterium]